MILNILNIGELCSVKCNSVQNGLPDTPNSKTLIVDFQSDFSDNSFTLNKIFQESNLSRPGILTLKHDLVGFLISFRKWLIKKSLLPFLIWQNGPSFTKKNTE